MTSHSIRACVVLLSGGVDSAIVLATLRSRDWDVQAAWVDYGQPAANAEREASRRIADHLGTPWRELTVKGVTPPSSGEIPHRNDLLLALASAAFPRFSVALGIHGGSTYIDCSEPWGSQWEQLLSLQNGGDKALLTPLLRLSKTEVFSLLAEVDIPLQLTHSCEVSDIPCGQCLSCKDRELLSVGS